jgi:hypothetical protein
VTVNGTTSGVTVTAVDASTREITFTATAVANAVDAPAEGDPVLVSYSYVADHVYEVDQSAPTIDTTESQPDDGATINSTSPFLRITWEEDEYPGDSYTTVTLTKADLTDPDGTVMDLKDGFVTTDNEEFLYAATDLALGPYKLEIAAMDTAGNEGTETIEFTIGKRTQSITLRPGWNLVSLADSPADPAIDSLITVAAVDFVLTYDPTVAGGWLTAVRDEGGWVGDLTTIDSKRAYWVHTDTFDPIEVDVPGLSPGAAGLPPSHRLVRGWNLVPVGVPDLTTPDRDADEYFSGLDWSRAFGYDNKTNSFESLVPGGTEVVTVGQGYWLFLNNAGTLVP